MTQLDRIEAKLDLLLAHLQVGKRPRKTTVDIQEWAKKQLLKKV